jgi:NarL family two-component system response regulator LiaR
MIRVIIADDHPAFVQGFAKLLNEQPDLQVIGTATNGEEAVTLAKELKPDVIVMDIAMPTLNGIEATKRIKEAMPTIAVLILSAYGYQPYVQSALEAGAGGYLLKNAPLRELMNAVRALPEGEAVFQHPVLEKLLRTLRTPSSRQYYSSQPNKRELKVLKLGARGWSNKQIGDELAISERTVQTHFTSIFAKFGVGSRVEAILHAFKEGWITTEDLP